MREVLQWDNDKSVSTDKSPHDDKQSRDKEVRTHDENTVSTS